MIVNPTVDIILQNMCCFFFLFYFFPFCSESALEQFRQLASEHGGQKWQQERQQLGAEQNETSGRSNEAAEETQLVVLDPEHVRNLQILLFAIGCICSCMMKANSKQWFSCVLKIDV